MLDAALLWWGGGLGDGKSHDHNNTFQVPAGKVRGITQGAFYKMNNDEKIRHAVLLNTTLHCMGLQTGFGEAAASDVMGWS